MPFVENYDALASLLAEQKDCPLTARIEALGQAARRRLAVENRPPELAALTEREYGIVCLMGQAAEQPGDRGEAVSVRGQRKAVREPDLLQAAHRRRHPDEAGAADGAAGKELTKG